MSRIVNDCERSYFTTDKEMLAIVYCKRKLMKTLKNLKKEQNLDTYVEKKVRK